MFCFVLFFFPDSAGPAPVLHQSMAALMCHNGVECGISMPLEDGQDRCILYLDSQDFLLARGAPRSCLDCLFCQHGLERLVLDFFAPKHVGPRLTNVCKAKAGRVATSQVFAEPPGLWAGFTPRPAEAPGPSSAAPPLAPRPSLSW